jgi:hypothetical protein
MLLHEVCADAPDEPRHWLGLARLLGAGDAPERAQAEAIWLSTAADANGVTSSLRVDAMERLARAAAARDDREAVAGWIAAASALPVEGNEQRQLLAEQLALAHRGPAATQLYAYFFLPGPIDAPLLAAWAVAREPELGFAHYLLGLQRLAQSDWPAAATELDRALALGLPDRLFLRNAGRQLAIAAYRSHDTERLGRAIATLSGPEMTTSDRLLAKDWEARAVAGAKR